jgi:hypothetical protein
MMMGRKTNAQHGARLHNNEIEKSPKLPGQ